MLVSLILFSLYAPRESGGPDHERATATVPADTGDTGGDTGTDTGAGTDTGSAPCDSGDTGCDTGSAPCDSGDTACDTGSAPCDSGDTACGGTDTSGCDTGDSGCVTEEALTAVARSGEIGGCGCAAAPGPMLASAVLSLLAGLLFSTVRRAPRPPEVP